jgi:hypothetical protein
MCRMWPTDVSWIHWSSLVIFLGGDGGYEHPPPPPCNQELQQRRFSLVHDDRLYPHYDTTTV